MWLQRCNVEVQVEVGACHDAYPARKRGQTSGLLLVGLDKFQGRGRGRGFSLALHDWEVGGRLQGDVEHGVHGMT